MPRQLLRTFIIATLALVISLAMIATIKFGLGLLLNAVAQTTPAQKTSPGRYYNTSYPPSAPLTGSPNNFNPNNFNLMSNAQQGINQKNIMIILDASESMRDRIPGGGRKETKMAAAKRAVLDVLKSIPADTRLGLRVYGNSRNSFFACRATKQLVPLGINNRLQISSELLHVKAKGMTPISHTILQTLEEDFYNVTGEKSIILISDGIETCSEDPCRLAVRLQKQGVNVKINVIGLGLTDYAAVKQLRCVALGTKARFYNANTAAGLARSLTEAFAVKKSVQASILSTPSNSAPVENSNQPTPNLNAPAKTEKQYYKDDVLLEASPR
ncbi:MAG: VWA domain-containing protein [Cyanobacteria bacterium P01_H01_bin.74]